MTSTADASPPRGRQVGTQTLARGLRALELVAQAPDGTAIQDVAADLGVHRTVAYRLLATLEEFRLVSRGGDGRFRTAAGLAALAQGGTSSLREMATPYLRDLAQELESTVALLVAEGDEAIALAVLEPANSRYHISFREGSRHPLDRGSAGIALQAALPPRAGESEAVAAARRDGHASTQGQVEPGAYGIAAPLRAHPGLPPACLNVITYRADVAERAVDPLLAAVRRIDDALG